MTPLLLNGLVAIPFVFCVLTGWVARRSEGRGVSVALVGGIATFGWSVAAVVDAGHVDAPWIDSLGVRWHLGIDGLSGPFVLMSTLVFACCLFSLLRHAPDQGHAPGLAALLLLIEAGVLGSFLALDMVVFFAFFEVALIPMWFVISVWGDPHDAPGRRRAATRFLIFTVTGSALMLVGFLLVHTQVGTFDIVRIASTYYPGGSTAVWGSVLIGLGLAVKTPLWPLHIWLPDAHSKAPTVGSVVLAAVLLKLGTYGFLRFWLPVTHVQWRVLVPFVAALAVVAIWYGALACLAQTELKRLVAYSSVGHMGFVILAVATFTIGGVQAAVFASVAHGLITGSLFFLAGAIKDRFGTGELTGVAGLSALYRKVPRLAGLFAFTAFASLGLPGLAGFWGEVLAIRASLFPGSGLPLVSYQVLSVLAAFGVILTTAYFLKLMRGMLQGDLATGPVPATHDVGGFEWVAWTPLLAMTVVLGVAPGLLLGPVADAARAFLWGIH